MKNLALLQELTNKEFNKSTNSTKGMNDFIMEVLKGKELTRVEMVFEISVLRFEEITGQKLTDELTTKADFAETWKKVNVRVKNGIDTNISKNNREPQYGEFKLKMVNNKYKLVK